MGCWLFCKDHRIIGNFYKIALEKELEICYNEYNSAIADFSSAIVDKNFKNGVLSQWR